MKIIVREPESTIFPGTVIQLVEWNEINEITLFEKHALDKYKPFYIYCEVESTRMSEIQKLEKFGYGFVEFRVQSCLNLSDIEISTKSLFPYKAGIIGNESELKEVVSILISNPCDDRYSNDHYIGKSRAKKRNIENLRKSFSSFPEEFLLGIYNSHSNKIIAFRSGRIISVCL